MSPLACLLAVIVVMLGCGQGRAAPPADDARVVATGPADAGPDAEPERGVHVLVITGAVERRSGNRWVPIAAGEVLSPNHTIRTGDGASAELDVAGAAMVTLAERSEITVGELSRSVSQVLLDQGRMSAAVAAGSRIRIATRDNGAVAESAAGRFSMTQHDGQVAVAVEDGSVAVSAQGRSVEVQTGDQTIVPRGRQPTTPHPIPSSLFLKVGQRHGGRGATSVTGRTAPGAVVDINGAVTVADEQGRFTAAVSRREEHDVIVVQVEDVMGRRERRVLHRTIDRKPPDASTSVEWR